MSKEPSYEEIKSKNDVDILILKNQATKSAFNLLIELSRYKDINGNNLQIATSESLTAGLIMSTLVDIPFGGYLNYGCFGVYDTNAKRVFNGVSVKDVYTHKCAGEMAIGVLKNSNATLAISVTGNSKPFSTDIEKLGEVFIGVAGYDQTGKIIYVTKSINACIDNNIKEFKNSCQKWYSTIVDSGGKKFNDRSDTTTLSQEIRYYTAQKAYEFAVEFVQKFNPQAPQSVIDRKKDIEEGRLVIPNKFEFGGEGQCLNDTYCDNNGIRDSSNVNIIKSKDDISDKSSSNHVVESSPPQQIVQTNIKQIIRRNKKSSEKRSGKRSKGRSKKSGSSSKKRSKKRSKKSGKMSKGKPRKSLSRKRSGKRSK
jgi:nicotinamide mononucleotide (NMN) deamidase PncC